MRKLNPNFISFFLLIFIPLILPAQDSLSLKDSIPVNKPKKAGRHYVINHASLGEISIKMGNPIKFPFPGGRILSDSANDAGASFETGYLGLHTARARTFLLHGELDCENPGLNWAIALFSEGLMEKTFSSVKQEDGSRSLTSDKTITLYWNKGAGGMIVEQADTIGRFYIEMDCLKNEFLKPFTNYVYSEKVSPVKSSSRNEWYLAGITRPIPEYGIYGKIRGRNFALLTNGKYYQSYIFVDAKLVCFFQSDIDFQPGLKKKDRVQPYILYDDTTPILLQNDLFRLAIMSRLLMEALGRSVY